MNHPKALLVLLFCACFASMRAQKPTYDIPQRDIAVRDPFVCVDHRARLYYIITAARADGHMALRAYESPDLEMWRDCGIVYRGDQGAMLSVDGKKDHWWAPDTYRYRGRYYTIVTLTCQQQGRINFCTLLRGGKKPADTYENIWEEGQSISLSPRGQQCLDGSLYVDAKGHPWLVYSLEWNGPDVKDLVGETWAVRLKKSLRGTVGKPIRLFRATDAQWPQRKEGTAAVVDAPFLWKDTESGNLICLWSTFRNGVYCVGQAISASGSIEGPWEQIEEPIYVNGGHEMVFRGLDGQLRMSLHHDNSNAHLRIVPIEIRDGRVMPVGE